MLLQPPEAVVGAAAEPPWRDIPIALDTVSRAAASEFVGDPAAPDDASTRYCRAYLAALKRDGRAAITAFISAQAAVRPGDERLAARICLELGFLYLSMGHEQTAAAVLAWGESAAGPHAADVVHLRALLCDAAGDLVGARELYRDAIRAAHTALSPMTYVLALSNLAVALSHQVPAESVQLTRLSLETMTAARLHSGIRPALLNTLGYARLCLGEVGGATNDLEEARDSARTAGNLLVEQYATFNLAIGRELAGDLIGASSLLEGLTLECDRHESLVFGRWVALRRRWLGLLSGTEAERMSPAAPTASLARAHRQLEAIESVLQGRLSEARSALAALRIEWMSQGDSLSEFATLLWLAFVELQSSRETKATAYVRDARLLSGRGGYNVSPNWWFPAAFEKLKTLCNDDTDWFSGLWRVDGGRVGTSVVELWSNGRLLVGGTDLSPQTWRAGRTGPRVLQRYLSALAAAHPQGIPRDVLCDQLWPESDGDCAIANLYAATHDLRRLLASVPGIRLVVAERTYSLRLGANAVILEEMLQPTR